MVSHELVSKILDCLAEEYQCIWLVDTSDYSMRLFMADEMQSIPAVIKKIRELNNYKEGQVLYIEECIMKHDRARMQAETEFEYIISKLSDGKPFYVEYSREYEGKINYNQLFYSGIFSDEGEMDYFVLGFRDIDIRKKAERDDLTGLYSRTVFFQKAEELVRNNPDVQYDLMISDIVDFKQINETYGPQMGDNVLRWAGAYLGPTISDGVLVGRYGGDQFVVLTSHAQMLHINSDASRDIFRKAERENGLPNVIVKYGVYEDVKDEKSILSACDKAHIALNSIKHQYGSYIAYYNEMLKKELSVTRKIESSMHEALEQEQFKVYYQPKHDAVTGKIVGAEALIRWIHPEYGFMSPGEFIPLFEKNGFVAETDYYVWKRTCINLRKWMDKGIATVPISVNASKVTFRQENLIKDLQIPVKEYNINPKDLHIEITETLMMDDVESLINKLETIREAGYQIELDDFGSGYSSINILSTIPMDIVKLDMSFMRQFGNEKRAKVLAACIKLAKELGYKTVSEGVEYKEQCEMLCVLGVDAIQGFYYSKPLPEEEFEKYMIENI